MPIDHERAFFKINVPDESGCAPDYTLSADPDDMAEHIAANLAGQHLDSPAWQEVLQAIERLTDQDIRAMAAKWPDELDRNWAGEHVGWKNDFIRFMVTRRNNAVNIVEEARRAVAKG